MPCGVTEPMGCDNVLPHVAPSLAASLKVLGRTLELTGSPDSHAKA